MNFQENLRKYRENAGFPSAQKFAEHLQIPYTTYISYENTGREPKYEMLCKIASALGCTPNDLLGYAPSPYEYAKKIVYDCDLLSFTDEQGRVGITDNGKYALKLYDTPEEFAKEVIRIHNNFQFTNLCIEAKQSYLLAEILKSQFK